MTAPSPPSPSGYLHNLCRQGNIIAIQSYLQGIDDFNKLEERIGLLGYTPLHEAVNKGCTLVVRLLLLHGANANAKANGFYTPLHIAVSMDNTDCVVELLKHGADITSRDEFGKTPYETALIHSCKKSAEILKSEESNQTKVDTEITDSKTELERVMSTMENLEIDFPDVKGTVGEMRTLPQANLSTESSKGPSGTAPCPSKRTASEAFEDAFTSEGDSSCTLHHSKRTASEASESPSTSEGSDVEFHSEVVFALDYSSSVSDEEFRKEFEFVKHIAESWNMVPTENSTNTTPLVVYADYAKTVPHGDILVSDQASDLKDLLQFEGKCRRMDLALKEAAGNFSASDDRHQLHQVVVLITAGRQVSGTEKKEDDHELLVLAVEELSSQNIKIIIVPVGLDTDFRELGLMVKRPQFLYPLSGFDAMALGAAQKVASNIVKTLDVETYAKNKLYTFSNINEELGLWENISLCSDVMEGAWYHLYDDKKKPARSRPVKKFIRESIDSFHSKLITESKISITLAVFGTQGKGKSFVLNSLLNWRLPDACKIANGPLPSGSGISKTHLPIYVKYSKKVQVLYKQKEEKLNEVSPDVWFPEEELRSDTLTRVKNLLITKFEDQKSLSEERCVELQGPFPVLQDLKRRQVTTSGNLELEVDVEFVDVPGPGDEIGDESVGSALSKADVVLFFGSGESGRPVSAADIAQIFQRHEGFEFTSRPKLVHIVNDRRETSEVLSCNFDLLQKEKEEDLERAWSNFLSSTSYQDERAKVPQLNGEMLLETLSKESEVIYFHPQNPGFLDSLKCVLHNHARSVNIKQIVHPFLQKVHCAAKKLKIRIGSSLYREKKKCKPIELMEGEAAVFKMGIDSDKLSTLVRSFISQTDLPLQSDFENVYHFLYEEFLYSSERLDFMLDMLKESLDTFSSNQIHSFRNANWPTLQDAPSDLIELVKILCESRVEQFLANSARAYLVQVLDKGKDRCPFDRAVKKRWSNASDEEKKELCDGFLHTLLNQTAVYLEKGTRNKQSKKSHFQLIEQLKQDVKELFAVKSLGDDASKPDLLKRWCKLLQIVISFCTKAIRDINPHPSLDVQADISLPEKMVDKDEDSSIPLRSNYEEIVKEVTELLVKPRARGTDSIRKLETKLKMGKNSLDPRELQNVDQLDWAKALVNVLCDKDHFDIKLEPSLALDRQNDEHLKLLKQTRKRLFAHQKSSAHCKIVKGQPLPENEIHLRKSKEEENCLEALISSKMSETLNAIREKFKDRSQYVAPIFIPTIRSGPTPDNVGNYFLEEDPWGKEVMLGDREEESAEEGVKEGKSQSNVPELNVFLVVEPHQLETFQTTIASLRPPQASNVNLMYVVLPQKGRGIGVTRAIIKILAECLDFDLYWTIDDDIQFMYQFDGNDRRWHKCSLTRGLLFGQRVFQTCLEKTVRKLSFQERFELYLKFESKFSTFAEKAKGEACSLLIDASKFAEVQKNRSLLHQPFTTVDCGDDIQKEEKLKVLEQEFVKECSNHLFNDTINHIAGVSIAHEASKKYDFMSKYPTADYMRSDQRYQVVLNNTCALRGRNFVTDEVIFLDEEWQVNDKNKRNTPYWGIRGSDKSFCRALDVGGVIGYRVIRIVHSETKLKNVFNRIAPSYNLSQSPHRSEDEDEELDMNVNS